MDVQSTDEPLSSRCAKRWGLVAQISALLAVGWVLLPSAVDVSGHFAEYLVVGNCLFACLTTALLGFIAARKNRSSIAWGLSFGMASLLLNAVPLVIGILVMFFTAPLLVED